MLEILRYKDEKLERLTSLDALAAEPAQGLTWIDLFGASPAELDKISKILGLHPVTRDTISRPTNRPRLNAYKSYLSLTIHVPGGHLAEPHSHEIDIVAGENWVLTVHEKKIKGLLEMAELCESRPQVMAKGSDFFLQEMLEVLLESFFPLLDWFDDRIGRLEDEITAEGGEEKPVSRVAELRRAVSGLRRTVINQREVIARLARGEIDLIKANTLPYFRDLYEQIMRASDLIDDARERLILLREMHMNQVSNRMNQVMKVLTVWATIFLPLTFLAGIWGMNFAYMPELATPWGYWAALGLMGVVAGLMVLFFKRKGWL